MFSDKSDIITPTNVTSGKSCPLVTSCVPGIDKKREITEIQLNYTQTEKASENQQIPRTFETNILAPETLEKQGDYSQNQESEEKTVENESLTEMLNIAESSEKPAQEWTDFADEVKKRSSMLASFVRNAVPQILTGTQLSLAFKSANYTSDKTSGM